MVEVAQEVQNRHAHEQRELSEVTVTLKVTVTF